MLSYLFGALVVVALAALVYKFVLPEDWKQAVRIWGKKGAKSATTRQERAQDNVDEAVKKLPTQRKTVAHMMTQAQNAQKAVADKKTECEDLLGKISLAQKSNASQATIEDLKVRWKTAKTSIATLEANAVTAHSEAEEAQKTLDGYLKLISTSQEAVAKIGSNDALAAMLRESAKFRQEQEALKKGLGSMGNEAKESENELADARNENELSKGSSTDREIAELERQQQVADADKELEAELAKRSGK